MKNHLIRTPDFKFRFRKQKACILYILALLNVYGRLSAQPEFSTARLIKEIRIYQDAVTPNLYYYEPGNLRLAHDGEGKPDFDFIRTRYTGTRLGSDQGASRFSSILRFRLVMDQPAKEIIEELKSNLSSKNRDVELRPLPIKHLKSTIVYQAALPNDTLASNQISTGYVFASNKRGYNSKSAFWSEREYVLRLDNFTSQIFWKALQVSGTVLSIGYAFYAEVIDTVNAPIHLPEMPNFVKTMHQDFSAIRDSANSKSRLATRLIKADAFSILVDTKRWPELLQQVDINERIPPDYAALDIYCYDFNNGLRPDLYAKRIELEATGVGGRKVSTNVTFRQSQPDLYAHNIRFSYAVRVDMPFQFRIVEIPNEGKTRYSAWEKSGNWSQIIDVTTPSEPLEKIDDTTPHDTRHEDDEHGSN